VVESYTKEVEITDLKTSPMETYNAASIRLIMHNVEVHRFGEERQITDFHLGEPGGFLSSRRMELDQVFQVTSGSN
jgi:hypothetical protein